MNYIPFLKFKVNEVGALKELEIHLKETLTPFFDLPRKENISEEAFKKMIEQLVRKYELNLKAFSEFYLDNFDIDDSLKISGDENYKFALEKFINTPLIPVVGLDRSPQRNQLVFDYASLLKTDTVAIRLTSEDLDYQLNEDDLNDLLEACNENYKKIHLIIDNRICLNIDVDERAQVIIEFIEAITKDKDFDKIIVAGSSIPASIRDILDTGEQKILDRDEISIYRIVKAHHNTICLGDYTVVSPNYSDVQVRGELMGKVTTPKVFYPFSDKMFATRGYALETHPRGHQQYNDLSLIVIGQSFYRTKINSFGDNYIYEKAHLICKKNVTPSSIPKPLVNLHISFMLKNFVF
ncbi:beta family protein [Acinetobacter bereziniae]|uniref:beta family protein n=1 Tax=Acinetobacter bereziniae TaxID=106648 RepID=UPI003008D100